MLHCVGSCHNRCSSLTYPFSFHHHLSPLINSSFPSLQPFSNPASFPGFSFLPLHLPQHILLFFVQLLVAIEHVHKLNILHRDLKTQNVMFNRRRNILKIGDFGISKVLSSKITSAQTVTGALPLLTQLE